MSKVAVLMAISAIQALSFVLIGNAIMEIQGMYWQYWLVLFSAWVSSNLMGLVISDSFKTVVTIYILIPFLVIPQILLSGIIVKYENINPKIASPTSIPWYGEIITARWAYEALATYQFINNDYQSQFYKYDKAMSEAAFRRDYWCTDLTNKVNYIERYMDNGENQETIELNLKILQNEIRGELKHNTMIPFDRLDELAPGKFTTATLEATREYIDKIKRYNIKLYNKANSEKDHLTNELQKDEEATAAFFKTKQEHNNQSLEDFVKNRSSSRIESIMQYKDRLYQKSNPIYLDPTQKFIKAQFYAPRKQVFGNYYSTFAINILVIWVMTITLYVILYYRLLKKFLDFFEEISHRFTKGE
jgi:hypothetical protein